MTKWLRQLFCHHEWHEFCHLVSLEVIERRCFKCMKIQVISKRWK
jgi:hypothetical protein